jgi:hypothetical protein
MQRRRHRAALGRFTHFDHRIADPHRGVRDGSVFPRHSFQFLRIERLLQKFHQSSNSRHH